MLLYNQGRMSYGNISFVLPDGLLFDGAGEICDENMVSFSFDPEKYDIIIDVLIHDTDTTAKEFTDSWFAEDENYDYILPISPVQYGGLSGYHALYRSCKEKGSAEHYAAFLENGDVGEDNLVLELTIDCRDIGIEDAIKRPEIKALIESIRVD